MLQFSRHSRVLSHSLTALHFCSVSRTFLARWQHSMPSGPTHHFSSRNCRPGIRPPPKRHCHTPCWYHHRYRALCLPSAGKLTQQTSTAAHVCPAATALLFITVRFSKQHFTDSDLCVYIPIPHTGLFRDARNVSTTISVQLTALPSPPTDDCPSATTSDYTRISRGGSWWPMLHIPSSASTLSTILACVDC